MLRGGLVVEGQPFQTESGPVFLLVIGNMSNHVVQFQVPASQLPPTGEQGLRHWLLYDFLLEELSVLSEGEMAFLAEQFSQWEMRAYLMIEVSPTEPLLTFKRQLQGGTAFVSAADLQWLLSQLPPDRPMADEEAGRSGDTFGLWVGPIALMEWFGKVVEFSPLLVAVFGVAALALLLLFRERIAYSVERTAVLLALPAALLTGGGLSAAWAGVPFVLGMVEVAHAPEEPVEVRRLSLKTVREEAAPPHEGLPDLVLAHTMDTLVEGSSVTMRDQREANERRWEAVIRAVLAHLGVDSSHARRVQTTSDSIQVLRDSASFLNPTSRLPRTPKEWLAHVAPGDVLIVRRGEGEILTFDRVSSRRQVESGIIMKELLQRRMRRPGEEGLSPEQLRAARARLDELHPLHFSRMYDNFFGDIAPMLRSLELDPQVFDLGAVHQALLDLVAIRWGLTYWDVGEPAGLTTEELLQRWQRETRRRGFIGPEESESQRDALLMVLRATRQAVLPISLQAHRQELHRLAREHAREHPGVTFTIWEIVDDGDPPYPLLLVVQKHAPPSSAQPSAPAPGGVLSLIAPLLWSGALPALLELGPMLLGLVAAAGQSGLLSLAPWLALTMMTTQEPDGGDQGRRVDAWNEWIDSLLIMAARQD
jgi:hypothetical protein